MSAPVELNELSLDPVQKAVFLRRRRARNYLLLTALGGFCLMVYIVTLVKLHACGASWP